MGLINVQYILYNDEIYVIEVNPRSSRTIPYISKVTGVPIVELATRVMLGEKLKDMELRHRPVPRGQLLRRQDARCSPLRS